VEIYQGISAGIDEIGNGGWVVNEEGCRQLSLPSSTLRNWVKAARAGKIGEGARIIGI